MWPDPLEAVGPNPENCRTASHHFRFAFSVFSSSTTMFILKSIRAHFLFCSDVGLHWLFQFPSFPPRVFPCSPCFSSFPKCFKLLYLDIWLFEVPALGCLVCWRGFKAKQASIFGDTCQNGSPNFPLCWNASNCSPLSRALNMPSIISIL